MVEAAEFVLAEILAVNRKFRDERPVMLLDIVSGRIYAWPYESFKADLDGQSQAVLTADYERGLAGNKVGVFVRDEKTKRLISMLFNDK